MFRESHSRSGRTRNLVFSGGAIGSLGGTLELPQTTSGLIYPEPTLEEDEELGPLIMLDVDLDIKPGSEPNSVNCGNQNAMVAVAITSNSNFDAREVDHTTVMFEGAAESHRDKKTGVARRHEEDIDNDGDIDLIFHFRLGDTELTCDSIVGVLQGEAYDGAVSIQGWNSILMVGGSEK